MRHIVLTPSPLGTRRRRWPLAGPVAATWLAAVSVWSGAGCLPDHRGECQALYRHLAGISEARRVGQADDGDLEARFIETCEAAYEADRHACLAQAGTVDDALACKASRLRPR